MLRGRCAARCAAGIHALAGSVGLCVVVYGSVLLLDAAAASSGLGNSQSLVALQTTLLALLTCVTLGFVFEQRETLQRAWTLALRVTGATALALVLLQFLPESSPGRGEVVSAALIILAAFGEELVFRCLLPRAVFGYARRFVSRASACALGVTLSQGTFALSHIAWPRGTAALRLFVWLFGAGCALLLIVQLLGLVPAAAAHSFWNVKVVLGDHPALLLALAIAGGLAIALYSNRLRAPATCASPRTAAAGGWRPFDAGGAGARLWKGRG